MTIKMIVSDLDGILLNDKSIISSETAEGVIILQEEIEERTSKNVIDLLEKYKIDFEINTSEGDFATDCRFCTMDLPIPDREELKNKELVIRKFFIFSENLKKLHALKHELENVLEITVTSSASWNIEITGACAQKGMMLQKVIQYYGIPKEQVLVFGDGENDISLNIVFMGKFTILKGDQLWD